MKRCYVVVGPESSGNRLLASILVRAGCIGSASTEQPWGDDLPSHENLAVVIRSYPHGEGWPYLNAIYNCLEARDYEVFTLITVRSPVACLSSQVAQGHAIDSGTAAALYREAYRRILADVRGHFYLVPIESLILHPREATAALLALLGLPPVVDGPLIVNGRERHISDENWKHYQEVPKKSN